MPLFSPGLGGRGWPKGRESGWGMWLSFAGLAGGLGEGKEEEEEEVVVVDVWRTSHGCGRVRRHDRQSRWEDWRCVIRKGKVVGLCIEMVEGLVGGRGGSCDFSADTRTRGS